jgi:uncharacterized protein (UPF0332 family)
MFAWLDYITLAKQLATGQDEASQRSSISRAYYAAFHTAKEHVEQTRPDLRIPTHGGNHTLIWETLSRGARQERTAGQIGDRLRKARTKADYVLRMQSFPQDTKLALEWAEVVIRSLQSMGSHQ